MKAELIQKSVREEREVVEYQLQTGELMDGVVLKKCKENMISSVLPTGALFEGGRNYVFSYTDQKDTLRKIFSNGVSAAIALKTFENILKTIQYYQQESIQLAYFIYDPDYIYWNSRTNSAEFTCFPIKNTAFDMQDIANGLRKLLAYAVYGENENGDYVAKLLSAINRGADLETILGTVEVLMNAYGIEPEKKTAAEPEVVPQAVEQAAAEPEVVPQAVEQPVIQPEVVPQAVEQVAAEPEAVPQPEVVPQVVEQVAAEPEVVPQAVEQPVVEPEAAPQPEVVPQAVEQPVVEPEAAAQPEAVPQAVAQPVVEPEPAAQPEAVEQPVVEPEAAPQPEVVPEIVPQAVEQPVVEPEAAPEAVEQPIVEPEAAAQPEVVPEIVPQAVEQPVVEPQAAAQPEVTPQPQAVPQPDAVPHPYLIRTKTGEKIMLTDGDFVIGKSANNTNYVVTDNTAVSRVHCTIYKKKGAFFVRDERSTNSTFVNGEQVLPGMDHVLINNCKLVLGDEEFTYHLW